MKTNQEIINETIRILNENPEWKKRYARYADKILSNSEKYHKFGRYFSSRYNLSAYTTLTQVTSGYSEYDIRFIGQSIGKVNVKENKDNTQTVTFTCGQGLIDLKENRGLSLLPDVKVKEKLDWYAPKMECIRRILKRINIDTAQTKSPEHKCENLLLKEFNNSESKTKSLCNIKPVKLAERFFFQLTTPISASKKDVVLYSGINGGGIDILARVRHKNNRCYLSVIELKDENKPDEPMSDVIQQALSYATFLAMLLESESGEQWWKIFGFNGKTEPKKEIDVVGLMPNNSEDSIVNETYQVGDFILNTHAMYYDKNALFKKDTFEFSGDYVDVLMP